MTVYVFLLLYYYFTSSFERLIVSYKLGIKGNALELRAKLENPAETALVLV